MIEETDEQVMDRQSVSLIAIVTPCDIWLNRFKLSQPNPHRVPLPPSTAGGTHYHPARSMQSFMSSKFKPKVRLFCSAFCRSTLTSSDISAARHAESVGHVRHRHH
jgi:hypothetical protein